MVKNSPIVEWSDIQMASEYWTKNCQVFEWWSEYRFAIQMASEYRTAIRIMDIRLPDKKLSGIGMSGILIPAVVELGKSQSMDSNVY